MCCSWDCPNAKNISYVSGGRLVKRGQILFQAEFVHKIAGVPTQCQADIRAKQTAGLLVFHRFPIGSGRSTAHTANKAKPTVPPIQQSWLQHIQNPTIHNDPRSNKAAFNLSTAPAHSSQLLLPGKRVFFFLGKLWKLNSLRDDGSHPNRTGGHQRVPKLNNIDNATEWKWMRVTSVDLGCRLQSSLRQSFYDLCYMLSNWLENWPRRKLTRSDI